MLNKFILWLLTGTTTFHTRTISVIEKDANGIDELNRKLQELSLQEELNYIGIDWSRVLFIIFIIVMVIIAILALIFRKKINNYFGKKIDKISENDKITITFCIAFLLLFVNPILGIGFGLLTALEVYVKKNKELKQTREELNKALSLLDKVEDINNRLDDLEHNNKQYR